MIRFWRARTDDWRSSSNIVDSDCVCHSCWRFIWCRWSSVECFC